MRRWMKLGIVFVLTCSTIFFGIFLLKLYENYKTQKAFYDTYSEENWVNPLETSGIKDNLDIYRDDDELQVDDIYITVFKSEKSSKDKTYDFKDIITFSEVSNSLKPKVKVFFQDGDKSILDNGIFIREPNATIEIRGKSSRKELQKSFKIRLYDREGLWHNQNIINLNKHYSDPLRIRNKLSFDYFKIIPNITSLRTRFVRLFIKDLSTEDLDQKFVDYGFFTQLEQPNKLFLQNHDLDPNGHLYKAENFKFLRYAEHIKNKEDSTFSKKNFEEILEIKGEENHQKLISMLDAVNNYSNDINEVVEIYFDKENYLTWVAVNILFDNYKKINTDFLLYSPLNSNKWYFMPWDFDGAWGLEEDRPRWQKGLSMFWDNVLYRRFFKAPENVEALNKKIEELSTIINKEQTKAFLESYYNIVIKNITKLPDLKYLPITLDEYKRKYKELPELAERNRLYYYELLENPMPFYLNEPQYYKDNKLIFTWGKSYDIQGDDLYYDLELSTDKNFANVIRTVKDIKESKYVLENLKKGRYYWRVTARDAKGNSQIAFDIFIDEFGDKYYGIKKFVFDDSKPLSTFREESIEPEIIEDIDDEVIIIGDVSSSSKIQDIRKDSMSEAVEQKDIEEKSQNDNKVTENGINLSETYDTYTLKAGETLYYVSMKFYGNKSMIESIRKLNEIEDINDISVGTVLKLPQKTNVQYQAEIPMVYRLKPGDTLYSVSMKFYGTKGKIDEIKELNNIKDINNLPVGMTLKLPRK